MIGFCGSVHLAYFSDQTENHHWHVIQQTRLIRHLFWDMVLVTHLYLLNVWMSWHNALYDWWPYTKSPDIKTHLITLSASDCDHSISIHHCDIPVWSQMYMYIHHISCLLNTFDSKRKTQEWYCIELTFFFFFQFNCDNL